MEAEQLRQLGGALLGYVTWNPWCKCRQCQAAKAWIEATKG